MWRLFFSFLVWCFLSVSCSNMGADLTGGAISAALEKQDSLALLTRRLTNEAATTASAVVRANADSALHSFSVTVLATSDTAVARAANRIDSSVEYLWKGADRTILRARDSLTGRTTQERLKMLVREVFQEVRRQQDSTLRALGAESATWEDRLTRIAPPVLAILIVVLLIGAALVAILKIFVKQS